MIFGITLTAILAGLRYSSFVNSTQEDLITVNSIITYIVEDVRAKGYSNIDADMSSTYSSVTGVSKLLNPNITCTSSVVEAGLKKVDITVAWDASIGKASPQNLTIYVAEP